MFPCTRRPAAIILMWSLISTLAAAESASSGSIDAGAETRAQPTRGAETPRLGLEESEPANAPGQAQDSTYRPGSVESRVEPPALGLCDGS